MAKSEEPSVTADEQKPGKTVEPDKLDDEDTDKAVDDIAKHDSDEVLEAEDAKHEAPAKLPWYKKVISEKKIWIPTAVILVLLLLFAVPVTRYKLLGLVLKQTYKVQLTDSQTGKPVSAATVSLDGKSATTDNKGDASLKVKVGSSRLTITKKYYTNATEKVLVGLKAGPTHTYKVVATGRQVPLTLVDKVSGAPIENAEISAAGTTAKTDKDGKTTIVLPADKSTLNATLTASSYNKTNVTIQVTGAVVMANTFKLVPAGTVYFLSNASGKIDVVSTNLDGSNRQTVLAGTGYEDPNNTSLLASRDWQYLALQAKRDTSKTSNSIYLIDTSTNKLTTMDVGDADFTPIGWEGHYFFYDVNRNDININQNNHEAVKSYNADSGKITTLDQTSGNPGPNSQSQYDGAYDEFSNFNIVNSKLLYAVQWVGDNQEMQGQVSAIKTVTPTGTKSTLKSYDATAGNYNFSIIPYTQQTLDIDVSFYGNNTDAVADTFLTYNGTSLSQADSSVSTNTFRQAYPTFLESPSGNLAFWGEPRDGKTSLFVGKEQGDSGTQIASLTDYTPFGWYSDKYLLAEKNGSELYILPANGGTAQKISDYFKPQENFQGYGGGYGGL